MKPDDMTPAEAVATVEAWYCCKGDMIALCASCPFKGKGTDECREKVNLPRFSAAVTVLKAYVKKRDGASA